jgi:hypothetical protein
LSTSKERFIFAGALIFMNLWKMTAGVYKTEAIVKFCGE